MKQIIFHFFLLLCGNSVLEGEPRVKRTKVKVQVLASGSYSDASIITLSESLIRRWKIPAGGSIQLRFGSAKQEVRVSTAQTPGVIRIAHSLSAKWGLSHGISLCLQYKPSSKTLQLGPLIAVLVSRVTGEDDRPFGANSAFCRELHEAGRVFGASVYFCTPDDVNGASDSVRGHYYAGRWLRGAFPIPDVIYNRLTSRKLENRSSVQQFISMAKSKYRSVMFNEKYLNKNEVFDALQQQPGIRLYLPESHLLTSCQMLKSMCTKYSTVFLKPITGSLGKGIIRIRKQPGGSFICHFTNLTGARKQSYSSLQQLCSAISAKIKSQRYQIQQGLPLISIGGRPVDFRALVQKGDGGKWDVTSIVARIAGNHHFVSNVARGGTLSTVKNVLSRARGGKGGSLKLKRSALQIAKGIDEQITGHFAELGIDLAMDKSGRVWLIEVNSKPSRDDNTQLDETAKIRPSVKTVMKYARYAARF